jgi:hypothetical protein
MNFHIGQLMRDKQVPAAARLVPATEEGLRVELLGRQPALLLVRKQSLDARSFKKNRARASTRLLTHLTRAPAIAHAPPVLRV